jgi:DNA-binding winged helix-turn-helix (wHTH) protein/TolB-like protein/thioredoxin-like negative regulator of GroEL
VVKGTVTEGTGHFYEFGPYRLDQQRHRLLCEGEIVSLPPKAIETLTALVNNPGKLLHRETLMEMVWPDAVVEDANLTVAISQLRKALNQNGDAAEFIQTIPRVGYRFVADLREVQSISGAAPADVNAPTTIMPDATVGHEQPSGLVPDGLKVPVLPGKPFFALPKRTLAFAAAAVLLTVGALTVSHNLGRHTRPVITSVAVLPLKNLTGDANDDYLAEGLTEGLIGSLSRVDGLRVICRGSAFTLRDKEADPPEVGRQLGVATVIQGSLLRAKDTLRVHLRLVSTNDGEVLWSKDGVTADPRDVSAMERELARSATAALRPSLAASLTSEIAQRTTNNPEAHQLYLRGRYFWNKRTEPDLERATRYLEQAINLDPTYAQAYSGLADIYAVLSYFSNRPFEETFPKAKAYAEKALSIDNNLADPHATLGLIASTNWDWARGEEEYQRALALNPNYATAHHWHGLSLRNMGRREESVREMQRALELDPLSIEINTDYGATLAFAGRLDEAIRRLKLAVEMDPSFVDARVALGHALRWRGDLPQAITELETVRTLSHDRHDALAELGCCYALIGERAKATQVAEHLKALPKEANASPFELAEIYAALGENEQAVVALQAAYQARSLSLTALEFDPVFASIKTDTRIQELVKSVTSSLTASR